MSPICHAPIISEMAKSISSLVCHLVRHFLADGFCAFGVRLIDLCLSFFFCAQAIPAIARLMPSANSADKYRNSLLLISIPSDKSDEIPAFFMIRWASKA